MKSFKEFLQEAENPTDTVTIGSLSLGDVISYRSDGKYPKVIIGSRRNTKDIYAVDLPDNPDKKYKILNHDTFQHVHKVPITPALQMRIQDVPKKIMRDIGSTPEDFAKDFRARYKFPFPFKKKKTKRR